MTFEVDDELARERLLSSMKGRADSRITAPGRLHAGGRVTLA
jgi:hypothetical protein